MPLPVLPLLLLLLNLNPALYSLTISIGRLCLISCYSERCNVRETLKTLIVVPKVRLGSRSSTKWPLHSGTRHLHRCLRDHTVRIHTASRRLPDVHLTTPYSPRQRYLLIHQAQLALEPHLVPTPRLFPSHPCHLLNYHLIPIDRDFPQGRGPLYPLMFQTRNMKMFQNMNSRIYFHLRMQTR